MKKLFTDCFPGGLSQQETDAKISDMSISAVLGNKKSSQHSPALSPTLASENELQYTASSHENFPLILACLKSPVKNISPALKNNSDCLLGVFTGV